MIAALVLIALTGAPPSLDLAAICKDAQNTALQEDAKVAHDSCMRDEQAARDKLKDHWSKYSTSARSACLSGEKLDPSYVEIWTCLEMQPGGSLSLSATDPNGPDSKLSPGAPVPPGTPKGPNAAVGSGSSLKQTGSGGLSAGAVPAPSGSTSSTTTAPAAGGGAAAPAPGAGVAGPMPSGASPSAPAPGVR